MVFMKLTQDTPRSCAQGRAQNIEGGDVFVLKP